MPDTNCKVYFLLKNRVSTDFLRLFLYKFNHIEACFSNKTYCLNLNMQIRNISLFENKFIKITIDY
jgi:hypothetical protein